MSISEPLMQSVLIGEAVEHAPVAILVSDEEGRYVLIRTVRELVPGRISFRLEFGPSDPELYTAAEDAVTLTALSPLTYPFARVAGMLSAADIAFGNLECPLSAHGTKVVKPFCFQARPAVAECLVQGGLDLLSVANNHTVDYGWPGLQSPGSPATSPASAAESRSARGRP